MIFSFTPGPSVLPNANPLIYEQITQQGGASNMDKFILTTDQQVFSGSLSFLDTLDLCNV